MLNIFETPWLIIAISFILLIAVYVFRTSFPEKSRWWHLLIPLAGVAAAFAIDHYVTTDKEQINDLINTGITAVEEANPAALEPIFAPDYSDRLHRSKAAVMQSCRRHINARSYQNITRTHSIINIDGNKASTELMMRVRFKQNKNTQNLTPEFIYAKVWFTLEKQPDQTWAVTSTDKVEINNNTVSWN